MKKITSQFILKEEPNKYAVVCTACWRRCIIGYLALKQDIPTEIQIEIETPSDCPIPLTE